MCMVIMLVGTGTLGRMGWNRHEALSATGIKFKELQAFSWPAQQIIRLYKALPPESQFGSIESIMRAMDTKHGVDGINSHFRSSGGDHSYYDWNCGCWNDSTCPGKPYKELRLEIKGIMQDLEDRNHKIQLAGLAHDLNQYDELMKQLSDEREAIRSGTKESVKELP